MVFLKWPITGILVEFVGFVGLFGYVKRPHPPVPGTLADGSRSFFPVILQALRQTPIIGTFLSLPYIRGVRLPPARSMPTCKLTC
jgi:hypothetical protein